MEVTTYIYEPVRSTLGEVWIAHVTHNEVPELSASGPNKEEALKRLRSKAILVLNAVQSAIREFEDEQKLAAVEASAEVQE